MKKQKKKSLQIVKRIVTLFLILAITSTQIEPSVFAASSDGQWASEALKEDAVTENKSADATADSTGTTNTDESHTDESETEKKPETTDGTAQDPGNTGTTDKNEQNPDNTDNTDKTEQDPDNTDTTDKTAQNPETTVTEEQPTEETGENLSVADAVLPVEISYYLPKFQELKIEAPEEYTDTEQQEEARAAVTDQAMADETTQKLLEQAEKDAESADADESAVDTQALTESAVSEEEYVSYTQMAVTGDTLAAPAVSLPDDVQLDPEADPEDTDPLIGWQVAKLAGIVLSYADGTKINEGDVIPADQINEVSAAAADDGIALLAVTPNMTTAQLIALTQDMTVVQRVGSAGTNGKWSILVQGGTNQTETQGTVRHAYGTLANALKAINANTGSNSFKITLLDDYTADSTDIDALGQKYIGTTPVVSRKDKPTIVFTGAVNYDTSTSYQSWNTLTFPNSSSVYFSGYDPYFTRINIDGSNLAIYGNQNNTSFVDMKFVSGVEYLYGGRYGANAAKVDYTLTLDQITTTAGAPIKNLYAGSYDDENGNITLSITNSEIYGNVYASGRSYRYTQTGTVTANLKNVSIYHYKTISETDMLNNITSTGGAFWGAEGKVSGNVTVNFSGSYYAQYGTWFGTQNSSIGGNATFKFTDITNEELKYVGNYRSKVGNYNYIYVNKTNLANVFGWDYLYLNECNVAPEQHFGHMQYSSSFYNYWSQLKGNMSTSAVPSSYSPDLTECYGRTYLKNNTKLNSTGQGFSESWSRQCYNHIYLQDNTTKIYAGGQAATANSNTMRVDGFFFGDGYKARLMCSQTEATSATAAQIFLQFQSKYAVTDAMKYMSAYSVSGVPYTMVASGNYLKVYSSSATQYKVTLTDYTGHVIKNGDYIATVLNELTKVQYPSGQYTVNLSGPYTLTDDDVTVLNTTSSYIQNQDIVIQGTGTFVAGGYAKGGDTNSYRFARVYPNFRSLTWKNIIFRQDFLDNSNSWYINANGHSMTFEDCTFIGPVIIDAGGNRTAGTSGSTLTVKNCINVNRIYANRTSNKTLGNTTITVESCSGSGTAGVTIDPASAGYVQKLTVNVTDTKATVTPTIQGSTYTIKKDYVLNVKDSNIAFTNPVVSSYSYTATTNLSGDIVLRDTCTGRTNSSSDKGKAILNVNGTVKTQEDKDVYLANFDTINVSGELRLGNYTNSKDSGFSGTYVKPDVTLSGSGKLILESLASGTNYRTIKSLKSTGTNTEISFSYIYDGTPSSLAGRPLIVENALTVPSGGKLRVSTALMPKHTGTDAYPLLQFNGNNGEANAKLDQYTWIADQRYYLQKGGRYNNQIVLCADTYAPLVYQNYTSSLKLEENGDQTGTIDIYIKDYDRDAIDTDGKSIIDASNNAYKQGAQVYLSTQDVQKKDGIFGYVYNKSTDVQLTLGKQKYMGVTFYDINGNDISPSVASPMRVISIPSRTYKANTNYYIYVRDIAGNWSKFLLDTKGPAIDYNNITSSDNNDGSFTYTFSGLRFTDAAKEVANGTSDIAALNYKANATKYINDAKRIKEVRWNKTGVDPWTTTTGSTTVTPSSTGTCTLSNVNLKATEKLYIFAMDGYGNKSKFEFVPVTFDATSGGATPDGKFPTGVAKTSTLILVGSTLKEAQLPADPIIGSGELAFKYWYYSTSEDKAGVNLRNVSTSVGVTFYPLWEYPTVTISNQVTGNNPDKSKYFTYRITVKSNAGTYTQGTRFECVGGTISGSGATKPTTTSLTMDRSSALAFTLKHGQTLTIKLQDYYGSFRIVQEDASPYWTTYVSQNAKYDGRDTSNITVNSKNWSYAFTNSNIVSQPVVYQSKVSGTWTTGEGDAYKRGIKLYIRDIYGNGIDKTGESFSTSEKGKYPTPSTTKGIGHIYLSSQDVKAVDGKYNFVYNSKTDHLLENIGSGIWYTQQTFWDINQEQIPIDSEHPVLDYTMSTDNYLSMDPNTKYFIYVRDITGNWTKFLLDTKGPELHDDSKIKTTKSGSTYTCSIEEMWFSDDEINADTSKLNNVEGFSYSSNATAINTRVEKVIANTTGIDPFENVSAAQWTAARNPSDDRFYLWNIEMSEGQTLYVFAIDAYGNKTAVEFIPVTLDATEGGAHNYTQFSDGSKIKSTLVVKGKKLGINTDQLTPEFDKATKQKFLKWYYWKDPNKNPVDLNTYTFSKETLLYASYEPPRISISQIIEGDGIGNNQEFTYKVRLEKVTGGAFPTGTDILAELKATGTDTTLKNFSLLVGADGIVTFSLKGGQSLELMPGDIKYKVGSIQQEALGSVCKIQVDGEDVSNVDSIMVDEYTRYFTFTNTKNIVVTGISDGLNSKTLPIVGLAAAVVMLGASALMLKRRRRS